MLVVETIARIRRDHLVRGVPIKTIARDAHSDAKRPLIPIQSGH